MDANMKFEPQLKPYSAEFKTIESHTQGEATRIIYDGFPELSGKSMMERKQYLEKHYDHYRKALMLEPRGHRDMFGALLTPPIHKEADIGVVFMDSGGYLNMCGHGSIGAVTVAVETGMVEVEEPFTEVVLEAPSGLIRSKVKVQNGRALEVSILNVPAFLYKENISIELAGYGTIQTDISFGGSFFALVDAQAMGLAIDMDHIAEITDLGMKLIQKINRNIEIKHPYLDITTVDLCEFYCASPNAEADMRNVVIFGESQADRSPCGTGTSAKLAALYAKGEIGLHKEFVYESITGTLFKSEAVEEIQVGQYLGIIPRITGSAYITGNNTWVLDEKDSHVYGFLFGKREERKPISTKSKIVDCAWELFHKKGYEQTSIKEICISAKISEIEFYQNFKEKAELLNTLSNLFDQKYAELMIEMNPYISHYEQLLYLNKELFTEIEQKVPVDLLAKAYSSQMLQGNEGGLMDKGRFYYRLLDQIFEKGQRESEFRDKQSYHEMAEDYALLERGLLYDWCIKKGSYDLVKYSQKMMPIYLKVFLK